MYHVMYAYYVYTYYICRYTLTRPDMHYILRKRLLPLSHTQINGNHVFMRDIIDILGFLKLPHINQHSSRAVYMKKIFGTFKLCYVTTRSGDC